jgi:transposase
MYSPLFLTVRQLILQKRFKKIIKGVHLKCDSCSSDQDRSRSSLRFQVTMDSLPSTNGSQITRQHENITGMFVQTKLQFQAVLDQVFPEYCGDFEAGEKNISNKIKEFCKSRSQQWANSQAEKLMAAAAQNPFQKALYHSLSLSLHMYINMLLEYKKHLSTLGDEIDALAKHIEECKIIWSIPGIGEKIAAMIISEIGEIDRFNHPKKLVAFAGIDPSIFESGTFKGTLNRITKR